MIFHVWNFESSVKRQVEWEEWGGRIGYHFRDMRNMTGQRNAACTARRNTVLWYFRIWRRQS